MNRVWTIFSLLIIFAIASFFTFFSHSSIATLLDGKRIENIVNLNPYPNVNYDDQFDISTQKPQDEKNPLPNINTADSATIIADLIFEATTEVNKLKDKAHKAENTVEAEAFCPSHPQALGELKYWKSATKEDLDWKSPFNPNNELKYVTFEPDHGGWNNIRMQMEMVVVFALVTGFYFVFFEVFNFCCCFF